MPVETIRRTSPLQFEAYQFDAGDVNAAQTYITSQLIGDTEFSLDENNNLVVAIGEHAVNGTVYGTAYDGDWIVKIHSPWWTIIPNNEFNTNWEVPI